MIVRLAMPDEESTLVEIARAWAAESYPDKVFSEERVRETFQRYLKTARPTFFFADQAGIGVVGVLQALICGYDFADGIYTSLCGIYVHPDKRGSRAAALLLSEFTQWSDRLGAIESTGGNDNELTTESTTRLLGRFGFRPVGNFVRRERGAIGVKKGR